MTDRERIIGLYQAFAVGDVPTVLAGMDPDIEWNEAEGFVYASGNPYRGPQAVLEGVFMRLMEDVEGFQVAPQRFRGENESVVVEGRYTGTWKSTGAKIDAQFAHVWDLKDGKVVRFQQYTDTAQWVAARG